MNIKHSMIDASRVRDRQQLAAALHDRRRKLGLSLMDVAARTGLSFSTVYHAERMGNVSARTAHALAPVYGIDAEAVLKLSQPQPRPDDGQEP